MRYGTVTMRYGTVTMRYGTVTMRYGRAQSAFGLVAKYIFTEHFGYNFNRQVKVPSDPVYTVESSVYTESKATMQSGDDDMSDSSFDEEPPVYSENVKRYPINDLNGLQRRKSEHEPVTF